MIQQIAIQIGNLPLIAIFLSNGQIGLQRNAVFATIIDMSPVGETLAILSNENIFVGDDEYSYNVAYGVTKGSKLREWLTAQKMQNPI